MNWPWAIASAICLVVFLVALHRASRWPDDDD